jgi:hypothetical protein
VCSKRYVYVVGADFGCSAACRFDWTKERERWPSAPPPIGSRVRVATGWDPLDGQVGLVTDHTTHGGVRVLLDGDTRSLRFGAGALQVLA